MHFQGGVTVSPNYAVYADEDLRKGASEEPFEPVEDPEALRLINDDSIRSCCTMSDWVLNEKCENKSAKVHGNMSSEKRNREKINRQDYMHKHSKINSIPCEGVLTSALVKASSISTPCVE
jgi:hypothetical protein